VYDTSDDWSTALACTLKKRPPSGKKSRRGHVGFESVTTYCCLPGALRLTFRTQLFNKRAVEENVYLISLYHDFAHRFHNWAPVALCLILVATRYSGVVQKLFNSRHLLLFVTILGLVLTLVYGLTVFLHLIYPSYLDHGEAIVASISWLGTHSYPIYPDLQTGDVYGQAYGPLLYITNGSVLWLLPTILGSKIAGCASFLITLALFGIVLAVLSHKDRGIALICFMIVIAILCYSHGENGSAFWNRPEPFLMLIAWLMVIAALSLQATVAATAIGGLAGLAINFKLPGAIYALPPAMAVIGTAGGWRERIGFITLSTIGAVATAVLPFLILGFWGDGSQLENYVCIVLITTRHGLALRFLLNNFVYVMVLVLPIITVWYFRRPSLRTFEIWFLRGLFLALIIVTVVASKHGSGTHYF
jgi:hypothetical protein